MVGSRAARGFDARELQRQTVRRFLEDFALAGGKEREAIEEAIKHMYALDLKNWWGIHMVQELKLLAKKSDRLALDLAIDKLLQLGIQMCFFLLQCVCFRNTLLDLIVSAEVDIRSTFVVYWTSVFLSLMRSS